MRFVSVSDLATVAQWPDGKETHVYIPRSQQHLPINSISWGKSGAWLILVQKSGTAEIFSVSEQAKFLHSIQSVPNVSCAVFQQSTTRNVAVGTTTGQLAIYDIKGKCIKRQFRTEASPFFKLQMTDKDAHVIGGCKNGKIYVYKTNTTVQTATFGVPKCTTLTNFRCHPIRANLVSMCAEEGVVAVWDCNAGKASFHNKAHSTAASDVLFRQDALISVGCDRRLCALDYRTNKLMAATVFDHTPTALDLHPDGHQLAVGFADGRVCGFDLRAMRTLSNTPLVKHATKINQVAFDTCVARGARESFTEAPSVDVDFSLGRSEMTFESYMGSSGGLALVSRSLKAEMNATDSFIDALSIGYAGECSPVITDGVRRVMDANNQPVESPRVDDEKENNNMNVEAKPVQVRWSVDGVKASSHSTPVHTNAEEVPSPIFPSGCTPAMTTTKAAPIMSNAPGLNAEEVRQIVRETIREELDLLKLDIKAHVRDMISGMKQNTLGLQVSIAKLSVNCDENIETLLMSKQMHCQNGHSGEYD